MSDYGYGGQVGGFSGYDHGKNNIGAILVLFILLVIIIKAFCY